SGAPPTCAADCAPSATRRLRAVSIRPWQDSLHIDTRLPQDRHRNRFVIRHQVLEFGSCIELRVDLAAGSVPYLAQLSDDVHSVRMLPLQDQHIDIASLVRIAAREGTEHGGIVDGVEGPQSTFQCADDGALLAQQQEEMLETWILERSPVFRP